MLPPAPAGFLGVRAMSAATPDVWFTSMKWGEMKFVTKMVWIGKLIIALCTFGFVYPNVMD